MTELEFYKDRCTKLEEVVNQLSQKLWGQDIHLANKISNLLLEKFSETSQKATQPEKSHEKVTASILDSL